MHKISAFALRTILFHTALACALLSPAIAQDGAPEEDQLIQDTIVVEYTFPGPPLWKVTDGENELLIFGVVQPVPRSFDWEPVRLERALGHKLINVLPGSVEL